MKPQEFITSNVLQSLNEEKLSNNLNFNDNFWKWFNGSKITENGEPLVCYHGTSNDNIKSFDLKKIGHGTGNYGHYGYGFYFSTDIREAKTYGSIIYKCYLRVKNPFYGTDKQLLKLKERGVYGISDLTPHSVDFKSFKNSFKGNAIVFKFLNDVEKHDFTYAWDLIVNSTDYKNIDANILDMLNDITGIIEFTTLNKEVDGVPEYVFDLFKQWNISPKINKEFKPHNHNDNRERKKNE
jgi:hypothetical protein